MSVMMVDSIKRWTAKRKLALVVEIIQVKTTVAEASRAFWSFTFGDLGVQSRHLVDQVEDESIRL